MEAMILVIALGNAGCLFCLAYCVILLRREVSKLEALSLASPQEPVPISSFSKPSKRKPVIIDDHRAVQLEREHLKKREIDLE